jgi:hypothetical protein
MKQRFHAEVEIAQLSKAGEELCGDMVEMVRTPEATIITVSDGLGSGVKANILATLTTKIAASMLKRGIPLEDVIETIAKTLPVCKQRKIAYSTLHIIKITDDGEASIVEFDSPASFFVRNGKIVSFPMEECMIAGKLFRIGKLFLQENDLIVAVSDGMIHAGIGGLLKLGWSWEGIAKEINETARGHMEPREICRHLLDSCEGYYLGQPGDDSTVVAVKVRQPRVLTLLTGPPVDKNLDEKVVKRFMGCCGKKAVAGGTTANIVSRIVKKPLAVDFSIQDVKVPPIGHLAGIDLVTEGVLTLNAAIERIQDASFSEGNQREDGASQLAKLLLEADEVMILAGGAVNPAHQNPNFPFEINIKRQLLAKLAAVLENKGKQVNIEWF